MVGDKGKKVKGDEENSEQIDGELVLSIEKLQEIQDELERINEEASDKVLEIDQKYNEIRKPVYDKRNEIIQSIPDFWLTAFLSHPMLGELLTDEDQKVCLPFLYQLEKTISELISVFMVDRTGTSSASKVDHPLDNNIFKYLDSLDVEDSKDVKSGYSINFNFRPNPFFEDSKLTKTYTFLDEGTKISATSIKWKEGMGLPNGVAREKKGNKRPLSDESFFHWFTDAQHKDIIDEIHDEIADIIKEDLWANPLTYFNNDADEDDEEGKDDDGSEDDEEDDDDNDGEEDSDEEDGQ